MHLDQNFLRNLVFALFLIIIFGSKLAKGKAVPTSEGLTFPMKPIFTLIRFVALPLYYAFFFYWYWQARHLISWPVTLLFAAIMIFLVSQAPGTIVLTDDAIEQRFWFLQKKAIQYPEIMAIQKTQGGRSTTVLGDNRVKITHTANHSGQLAFQQAIEQRTGKKILF
jgi:hypothetical protein